MSEIYYDPNKQILSGTIQFAMDSKHPGNCEFCTIWTTDGYNFMDKLVCYECREKLIKRINLIMRFE